MKKVLQYISNLWYARCRKTDRLTDYVKELGVVSMNKELEKMAQKILVENDMLNQIPINLIELATINNIEVYQSELPDDVSGAIKYDVENQKFKILVKASLPATRKRFTIAHELAHFFLHKNVLMNQKIHIDILYRNDLKPESKVDYLAGALLMDEMRLRKLYSLNPSISELAKVFNVSESAMLVRLKILGVWR